MYVLLCGVDPLRILIYKEGLARFATDKYTAPIPGNLNNLFMHLTNYAINKNNENFVFNENADDDNIGHKRSLTAILLHIEETEGVHVRDELL
jgi:tubulin polyglutamylase TTLL6/13